MLSGDKNNKYAASLILCSSVYPPWPFNHKRGFSEHMLAQYLLILQTAIVLENSPYYGKLALTQEIWGLGNILVIILLFSQNLMSN